MTFVTGHELKKPEKECMHLARSTQSMAGSYCNTTGTCPHLEVIDYNCPIIEYAREELLMRMNKIRESKHYEWVNTGYNKDTGMTTYSLLLKGRVKKEYPCVS